METYSQLYSQDEYLVHFEGVRKQYVRIELLDFKTENKVDSLEGDLLEGNITISSSNPIRRNCRLTLALKDKYIPKSGSRIWLDKKFRVFVGLKSSITGETKWFNRGVYVLNNPELVFNVTQGTISIIGDDYMTLLDGTTAGSLNYDTKLDEGTPIHESIRKLGELGGFKKFKIEDNGFKLPYTIEKKSTDSIYTILKEVTDLYMTYEVFCDEVGQLTYQKVKNYTTDPIIWNFYETKDVLTTEYKYNYNTQNVKNVIYVWGQLKDDKSQIKAALKLEDKNNPFSISRLEREIPFVVSEDNIFTNEQARLRCEYELQLHNNMAETVTITTVNIYMLDVNKLIYIRRDDLGAEGKYLITDISSDLKIDGLMSVAARKIYI